MLSKYGKLANKYRKILLIVFFNKCWFCGKTEQELYGKLQFFHIEPTKLNGKGRGFYNRMRDIINNPCKYGLACSECHGLYDGGLITIEDINI